MIQELQHQTFLDADSKPIAIIHKNGVPSLYICRPATEQEIVELYEDKQELK